MTYHHYTPRERATIIHLRFTAKRSLVQIAEILGAPISTIHKIVENGRRKYSYTLKKTDLRRLPHKLKVHLKASFIRAKPNLIAHFLYYTMGLSDTLSEEEPP